MSLLVVAALVGAGCSSDSDSSGGTTETVAPTPSEAPAGTPSATPAATAVPEPTQMPAAATLYNEPGPHPVGVMTLDLGGRSAEVWYPADPQGVAQMTTEQFDSASIIPEAFRSLLPEALQSLVETGAYRDAPTTGGGYPVVLYSHGFGGYRNAAIFLTVHLASWGFVVVSPDHTHRGLIAQSTGQAVSDLSLDQADIDDSLAALQAELPGLADINNFGVIGHSAGSATAINALQFPGARTAVSLAGGAATPFEDGGKPVLVISAELDGVVPPAVSLTLFEALSGPRVYVNIADAGHNSFTDSCSAILTLGGLGSLEPLLGAEQVARGEDGCTPDFAAPEDMAEALQHLAAAWFLDVLTDTEAPVVAEFADSLDRVELAEFRQTS